MRTSFSDLFARGLSASLEKDAEFESKHPRDEDGKFGPGFGTPKGPVEVFSQDQLRKAAKPAKLNEDGTPGKQYYKGVDIDLIQHALNFDPKETGLVTMVVRQDGKRVYQYSDNHKQAKAEKKFAKAIRMVDKIEPLRAKIAKDISSKDEQTRASATISKIIDTTFMRIGGGKTEEATGSSGASTLKPKHVTEVEGGLRVNFLGKSGVAWERTITDPDIVRNIKEFMRGKGPEDNIFPVNAGQVNRYLKDRTKGIARGGITAKDFRTFHASRIALDQLSKMPAAATKKEAKENIAKAIEFTAMQLGHTPSVCKSTYVNPIILEDYLERVALKQEAA